MHHYNYCIMFIICLFFVTEMIENLFNGKAMGEPEYSTKCYFKCLIHDVGLVSLTFNLFRLKKGSEANVLEAKLHRRRAGFTKEPYSLVPTLRFPQR